MRVGFELLHNSSLLGEYKDCVLPYAMAVRFRLFSPLCVPWQTPRRKALPLTRDTEAIPRRAVTSTSTGTSPPGPHTFAVVMIACWRLTLSLYRIKNPLAGVPKAQLLSDVEQFAEERDMTDILVFLKKGALVAQDPPSFETIEELDENDKIPLRREVTHRWSQPRVLYLTIALCSIGAAVQCVRCAFLNFDF